MAQLPHGDVEEVAAPQGLLAGAGWATSVALCSGRGVPRPRRGPRAPAVPVAAAGAAPAELAVPHECGRAQHRAGGAARRDARTKLRIQYDTSILVDYYQYINTVVYYST